MSAAACFTTSEMGNAPSATISLRPPTVADYSMQPLSIAPSLAKRLHDLAWSHMPFTMMYAATRRQRVTVMRGAVLVNGFHVGCQHHEREAVPMLLDAVGDRDAWIVFGPDFGTISARSPVLRQPALPVPALGRAVVGDFVNGVHQSYSG